jgi:hypothetical protein
MRLFVKTLFAVAVTLHLISCSSSMTTEAETDNSYSSAVSERNENVPRNPLKEAYFGDTHVHTGWSFDAGLDGATLTPDDAYRFALGEEVTSNSDFTTKLERPYDWFMITDHSDGMGTITAFTLAHSITLSLAVLRIVNLSGPPVEAVNALSIVFLAVEIVKNSQGEETLTSRKPWLVAFSFGLLHGFGFAGALAEVGLPATEIPLALAFFNIEVESGQIAFVLVASIFLYLLTIRKSWPIYWKKIPAYAIGSVAAFWLIERIVGFWS